MVRQIILTTVAVLLPAGAFAQGRGAMAAHSVAAAPRAMSAPHVAAPSSAIGTHVGMRTGVPHRSAATVGRTTRRVGVRNAFNNGSGRRGACANTAPGLGFDEAHLIAVCGPNAGFRGNGYGYGGGYYFPFYDGGFYMPGTAAADDTYAADNSQDMTDTDPRDSARRYYRAYQQPSPPPVVSTDEPSDENNEQYVFVRRDGTLFFAVAYSWEKGTLRYITSQGLRQTVTKDSLDLDATRQFNEQRGLSFQLPA